MCAFRFHFWGRKVNWNQASHVRASSVIKGESLCHSAYAMWSRGSWLGGSLVSAWCCVACVYGLVCVCFRFFLCFLAVLAILGLMTQCCHHGVFGFGLFCFCCLVLCFVWFVLCVFAVCLVYDDDGPMDYVQVLPQFSFAALNSRWPGTLIWNYCSCNVLQRGKRPGESHEGVGRKRSSFYGH